MFEHTSALDWYATMPAPSGVMSDSRHLNIRRYTGTSPQMCQPPLVDSVLCMHFGGPKEVRRWHAGRLDLHNVELGSLTIMPAGLSNRWVTKGPIDFVHLLLSPDLVGQVAIEEFDRDLSGLNFSDGVGFRDPYLEALFRGMTAALEEQRDRQRLYVESLLIVLTVTLINRRSTFMKTVVPASGVPQLEKGGLAPWKLRRVIDYMIEHRNSDIGLSELTDLVELSRAQFFRSFKQSTGTTPHRYLAELRFREGKRLLDQNKLDLAEIASASGFSSVEAFAATFRRHYGITPQAYWKAKR